MAQVTPMAARDVVVAGELAAAIAAAEQCTGLIDRLITALPALTEASVYPLDERMRAHEVLREAMVFTATAHAARAAKARRVVTLPVDATPMQVDLAVLGY